MHDPRVTVGVRVSFSASSVVVAPPVSGGSSPHSHCYYSCSCDMGPLLAHHSYLALPQGEPGCRWPTPSLTRQKILSNSKRGVLEQTGERSLNQSKGLSIAPIEWRVCNMYVPGLESGADISVGAVLLLATILIGLNK